MVLFGNIESNLVSFNVVLVDVLKERNELVWLAVVYFFKHVGKLLHFIVSNVNGHQLSDHILVVIFVLPFHNVDVLDHGFKRPSVQLILAVFLLRLESNDNWIFWILSEQSLPLECLVRLLNILSVHYIVSWVF